MIVSVSDRTDKKDLETLKIGFGPTTRKQNTVLTESFLVEQKHQHIYMRSSNLIWLRSYQRREFFFALSKNKHSKMTLRIYVTNTVECLQFFFALYEFFHSLLKVKTIFCFLFYCDLSKANLLENVLSS